MDAPDSDKFDAPDSGNIDTSNSKKFDAIAVQVNGQTNDGFVSNDSNMVYSSYNNGNDTASVVYSKDVTINIDHKDRENYQFNGLTKEQLAPYVNDPFWVRLRWTLLVLFWLSWSILLLSAILIVVLGDKCGKQTVSAAYYVSVDKFFDNDNDGVGDFKGLESKLDYIHNDIKADTIILNTVFSKFRDTGKIRDFMQLDARYGTSEDFQHLISSAIKRKMKIILRIDMKFLYIKHDWFKRSLQREFPYAHYFVWSDLSDSDGVPNNWRRQNSNESLWKYNEQRNQYYMSTLHHRLADLNFGSSDLLEEFRRIFEHYFDIGVHGFYISFSSFLRVIDDMKVQVTPSPSVDSDPYLIDDSNWRTSHDRILINSEPNRVLLEKIASMFSDYSSAGGCKRLLVGDIISLGRTQTAPLDHNIQMINTRLIAQPHYLTTVCAPAVTKVSSMVMVGAVPYGHTHPPSRQMRALMLLSVIVSDVPLLQYGQELGYATILARPMWLGNGTYEPQSESVTAAPAQNHSVLLAKQESSQFLAPETQLMTNESRFRLYQQAREVHQRLLARGGGRVRLDTVNTTAAYEQVHVFVLYKAGRQPTSTCVVVVINLSGEKRNIDVSGHPAISEKLILQISSNTGTKSTHEMAAKKVTVFKSETIVLKCS